MKKISSLALLFSILSMFIFVGCKDSAPRFTIEGNISGIDSTTKVFFEKRSLTEKSIIDSVTLDKDGSFIIKSTATGYTEFYLLKMGDQEINFCIDSTEVVKIKASKQNFATDYSIEGSAGSDKIKDATLAKYDLNREIINLNSQFQDKKINENEYLAGVDSTVSSYKSKARKIIESDFSSPAAYYVIFQKIGDYLIFDPYDKNDRKLFQAVATAWDQFKPNSPRSAHIKEFTLNAIAAAKKEEKRTEDLKNLEIKDTNFSEFFNVELPNMKGNLISLSSLKGKGVILDFTAYSTNFSPAHNIVLNSIYSKYKGSIEIYQISFDNDLHFWQNAASNLPWVCVRDENSLNSTLLSKFNVQGLPTMFLVDKQGNIVKRMFAEDDLEKEVKIIL